MSYRLDGYLAPQTASGVDGYITVLTGQDATGLNAHGGQLIVKSGAGYTDGYDGYVRFQTGIRDILTLDGYNASFFLEFGTYGSGKNVIFIANATVVPATNPVGGGILYVENGALKYRGPSGTTTTIASS